jgi:hypothetical protein
MTRIFVIAALLFAAACGGKSAPATHTDHDDGTGSGSAAQGPMMGHKGEHDDMSPELQKFREVFAPLWHAEKGAKRTADTCHAVPDIAAAADAIGKATPPPSAMADTWTEGTRALVAAVAKLADACNAKNDPAQFETAFSGVHDAIHHLMEMANMHHGEGSGAEHEHEHEM